MYLPLAHIVEYSPRLDLVSSLFHPHTALHFIHTPPSTFLALTAELTWEYSDTELYTMYMLASHKPLEPSG